MARDLKIRDEKLQYDINRKTAKISTLSSGKIDVYEYLTGEEILPSDQSRIIEQAMFTYIGITLLFEPSPIQASEIDYIEIFRCPRENQLARRCFKKFNLLLFFLIS